MDEGMKLRGVIGVRNGRSMEKKRRELKTTSWRMK